VNRNLPESLVKLVIRLKLLEWCQFSY